MAHVQVSHNVTIGILALQGAFAEHQAALKKLSCQKKIAIVLVRAAEDLSACDALIIPGGESTTIALLAKLAGLLEPLRTFLQKKPVWGTCAGAILLAQAVKNTKKGGQELLGGVSVTVARNGWGSQVESFEAPLSIDGLQDPSVPFMGVFIRAPVILALHPSTRNPPIEIIARLPTNLVPKSQKLMVHNEGDSDPHDPQSIVAVRQGRHMLTTFHPELTNDGRFHEYFVRTCVLPTLL
ncbi:PdxT/SNO family [Suillus paluster]|uniref:PdxT/SNO family n=1 Tax=Suillus paluster TaxID=48578 RepID=UPI001B867BCB|nr:PdxT/SNO family [Suillus paluster]KAG1740202.1 PdxT/SNO family [Suillus paluster]